MPHYRVKPTCRTKFGVKFRIKGLKNVSEDRKSWKSKGHENFYYFTEFHPMRLINNFNLLEL